MRFAIRSRPGRADWHDWFAWYPVRALHGDYVWLETVLRRGRRRLIANGDGMPEHVWLWEYQA